MTSLAFENTPLFLAPMAGVSDDAFRGLCIECAADLCFTEMVSAEGLRYRSARTVDLVRLAPNEEQVGVQLFGHKADSLASQAFWLQEEMGARLACIDINMGCPARKIVRKGDGCALMSDPGLACAIVAAVVAAVDVPVTVKFRRGFRMGEETAVEFAKALEDAGASALTLHGRFAEQYYQGSADWGAVARVKQAVSIPVTGNGDVRSGSDACAMREQTGCDAVMIGRAAQGNPWIFSQAKAALRGKEEPLAPSVAERLAMAARHARLLDGQGSGGLLRMRRHAMSYIAGIPGASQARKLINSCMTLEDFERVFAALLGYRPTEEGEGECGLDGYA
ncbi:MAG: tRNA dihydrouridine synthase DusB [Eggerthellaceae bacterium]|nr:tRNA dihydrouridine synthase DusB [Eggerthellaceae bacterium]